MRQTDISPLLNIDTSSLSVRRRALPTVAQPPDAVDATLLINTVSGIYETIAEPERWPHALDNLKKLTNAKVAISGVFDVHKPEVRYHTASSGFTNDHLMTFLSIGAQHQYDGFVKMYEAPPQTILHDTEVWPDRETFENGPMMMHLRQHHDVHHLTSANANPNASWFDYLVLLHGADQSALSEKDRLVLRFLLNHIAKANATRRPLALLQQRYRAVFAVLDRLAFGVILIDANRNIIASNKASEQTFDLGDCLVKTGDGRLTTALSEAEPALNAQIVSAIAAAQRKDATVAPACALARRSDRSPLIVEATPFSDDEQGEMNAGIQGALLFCIDPDSPLTFSTDGLTATYQLTPAESEICQNLVDGLSNDAIVDAQSIALSTVKTHIRAILHKTHTTNRLDLLRLAVKVTPPIVKDDDDTPATPSQTDE